MDGDSRVWRWGGANGREWRIKERERGTEGGPAFIPATDVITDFPDSICKSMNGIAPSRVAFPNGMVAIRIAEGSVVAIAQAAWSEDLRLGVFGLGGVWCRRINHFELNGRMQQW